MTSKQLLKVGLFSKVLGRNFGFLLFLIPPLLVLGLMNGMMDLFTQSIGRAFPGPSIQLWQRYVGSDLNIVVVSEGRFKYMTFFMVAALLYPGLFIFSIVVIFRNMGRIPAIFLVAFGLFCSCFWVLTSAALNSVSIGASILFQLTEKLALARYDQSFAATALFGAKLDFVLALFATMLATLAGCSIMRGIHANSDISFRELMRKRAELRLLLFFSSLFLTFVAIFVSEWLAWPARFVQSIPSGSLLPATGRAEEIVSLAKEIRLYYGTGYSLMLLSFALPSALFYQSCAKSPRFGRFKRQELKMPYLNVLSTTEFSAVLSIVSPLAIPLAASALGI
jgi:hypothetical protein